MIQEISYNKLLKLDKSSIWHGFTQMAAYEDNCPLIIKKARGRYLIDVEGKRYFDAISSLWAITLGHNVKALNNAIRSQLSEVAHSTLLGNSNVKTIEFASLLREVVPVNDAHILFASDGASAVEAALKIAYQYQINSNCVSKTRFLALGDAYHGDTLGALSVGDKGFGTDIFSPLCFDPIRAPGYRNKDWHEIACELIVKNKEILCSAILEPLVQGASGMLITDAKKVKQFVETCQENNVKVIVDEVATGFFRTGELFASNVCEIRPDIMCLGKGLSGGYLPVSATIVSDEIYRSFLGEDLDRKAFYHGHTFQGNALGSAVGLAHLKAILNPAVAENVKELISVLDQLLIKHISKLSYVVEVRQRGLMVGIELKDINKYFGRLVCKEALKNGVFLRPLGNVIVIMPPLTTKHGEIKKVVRVIKNSILEVAKTLQ